MTSMLRLGLTGLVIGWIASHMDWAAVGGAFARMQVGWWALGAVLFVGTQIISALRWSYFVRELNFERTLGQLSCFYFIGMFFNLMLPTSVGGDVIRTSYLDGGSGRKLAAFGAVLLDRLNGLLMLIGIACVASWLCPHVPAWMRWTATGIALGACCGMASLPLLACWRGPGSKQIQKVYETVKLLRSPHILWVTSGLSIVVQTANILIVWLIGLSLDAPVPGSFYWVLVPLMSLLMLLPISVGGHGIREGGMVLLLRPFGVGDATALALAVLWFANGAVASLLGGLIYMFGRFPKPERSAASPVLAGPGTLESAHGPVDRGADQGRAGQLDQAA